MRRRAAPGAARIRAGAQMEAVTLSVPGTADQREDVYKRQVYNLAGPMEETRSLRGFVEEIYRLCENRGSFEYGLRQPNAEGVVNLIPDIGKMKRVTGWTPEIHFEQGILNILRKL